MHSKFLCFAGDIKLTFKINSFDDCKHIQNDLDNFVE